MEIWLSIVGFLVVIAIIVSIMTKKLSTMVALSVIPLIGAILVGQFASIPAFLVAGVSKVAVNGVMFFFAILFFGSMMTAGAFDPIVNFIIKCCRGNPLYVCIGTYVLSIVGHLDGSATTTVLLVCGAMVPIYRRMNMRLRNLAAILAMGAGLMNISPWGGPTLRAATVMEMDLTEFFQPMLIPILITIAVGLVPVVLIGLSETKRLKAEGFDYAAVTVETQAQELSDEARALLRPRLVIPNLILIVLVVGLMISGILSPAAAFLTGTALTRLVPILVGVLATPLSLVFDADTFYYGILPVLTQSASAMGLSGAGICYAALVGQLTLGWAITPLTPATLLMTGMCDLDLGEHQRYTIKFVWPLSIVLLILLTVFGLIL